MRLILVLQLTLSVRFCHSWVAPTTSTKRSFSIVERHGNNESVRIRTPTNLFHQQSYDECHILDEELHKKFKGVEDSSRTHKFESMKRFGNGNKKQRRISMWLAMMSFISLMPSVTHAALSSTTLGATAATAMTMRTTAQSGGGLHAWHWVLAAMIWVWQSASPNLVPVVQILQASMAWYMMQLSVNPVVTKAITAGIISSMGDFLAQSLEHILHQRKTDEPGARNKYDTRRGLSTLLYGVLVSGPLMHFGYALFDHILPIHGNFAALAHVLADSIFLDSIFVATTYIVTGRMEGYQFRQIIPQLRKDYLPTLKASWATSTFLMPLEFICFRFLPLNYRVLSVNVLDVIWDGVISFMSHRNRKGDKHALSEEEPTHEEGATLQPVLQ